MTTTTTTTRPAPIILVEAPCPSCGCTHTAADDLMIATAQIARQRRPKLTARIMYREIHDILLFQQLAPVYAARLERIYHALCRVLGLADAHGHGPEPRL